MAGSSCTATRLLRTAACFAVLACSAATPPHARLALHPPPPAGCAPPRLPQADKFHKTGRQLRSRMWWQNMKMKLIVVLILVLIAVIIFCAVCFSGGKRCF